MQEEKENIHYGIIECESKFLNLFGYQIIGPNASNRYFILDSEEQEVGFIQYKKIPHEHEKKNVSTPYGYVMKIDSPQLKCKRTRKEDTLSNHYLFFLKRNGHEEPVKLCLGDSPSVEIWDKDYGYMSFLLGHNRLYCEFQSETLKYSFKELLTVTISDSHQKYENLLDFCEKGKGFMEKKDVSSFHFSFDKDYSKREIQVEELFYDKEEVVSRDIVEASGLITFEDVFEKYNLKAGSLERFQTLIDEILPLQKNLVVSFLEMVENLSPEIALFFTSLEKEMTREKKL